MGQGRCTGGQSPAEPLSLEASQRVEEEVSFPGELALGNCLCFSETGHGNFPEGHVLSFLLLQCVCHRRQGSVNDALSLGEYRVSPSSRELLGWTSATPLKTVSHSWMPTQTRQVCLGCLAS